MKKVVITGGAGFIGSNLGDVLIERGYEVHAVDNLSGGTKANVNHKAIFHEADIRDIEILKKIFKGADVVFHTAALPRVQFSIEHPVETNEVNVTGTMNVLVAAKESGVRRVVYSASSSAYGDQKDMPKTNSTDEFVRPTDQGRFRPLKEGMPENPKSPYGLHKFIGELYCRVWGMVYGLETVSLRYFNVYGPKMNPNGAYALAIGKFLQQRKEGKPITITGDGTQTRDFTHVRDVVEANILAANSPNVGKGEVFNIGAGRNFSMNKVAELIGGPIEHIAPRLEPHDTLADNKKAREILGWEPKIQLEEGIAELKKIWGV